MFTLFHDIDDPTFTADIHRYTYDPEVEWTIEVSTDPYNPLTIMIEPHGPGTLYVRVLNKILPKVQLNARALLEFIEMPSNTTLLLSVPEDYVELINV